MNPIDEAADPTTSAERLADLARDAPETRTIIAHHPLAYDGLLLWLGELRSPEVDAALASRGEALALRAAAENPETPQTELAELAHAHPELRRAIAANPAAYPALIEWIAAQPVIAPAAPLALAAAGVSAGAPAGTPPIAASATASATAGTAAGAAGLVWGPKLISIVIASALVLTGGTVGGVIVAVNAITGAASSQSAGSPSSGGGESGEGSSTGSTATDSFSDVPVSSAGESTDDPDPAYVPTVLILDASGSMVRQVTPGVTRMATARVAATTFVNGLGDDAQIGLTVFGTSTGNKDSDRAAGCYDVTEVVPVGPLDKDEFTGAISRISQSGFTPLGPAMRNAAAQLGDAETAQIVLVTDGVDTCSPPSACSIATELHESRPGLTIHTIGFLVDKDEEAQAQLGCIATAGGGEYVDAANAAQLAARLRMLSDPVATADALSARGLGALGLGMSLDQAKALDPSIEVGKTILNIVYVECDTASLEFTAGRLTRITPKTKVPTVDGLRTGDDISLAFDLYGSAKPKSDDIGDYVQFTATRGSDIGYRVYYEPTGKGRTGRILTIVLCVCGSGGGSSYSEFSNWLVTFDGVGPIAYDMSPEDAYGIVPDPGAQGSTGEECNGSRLAGSGVGSGIVLVPPAKTDRSGVIRVSRVRGVTDSSLPRTSRGIGIGSTADEVSAAYPGLTTVSTGFSTRYGILTDSRGVSMIFNYLDTSAVTSIQVGKSLRANQGFCP